MQSIFLITAVKQLHSQDNTAFCFHHRTFLLAPYSTLFGVAVGVAECIENKTFCPQDCARDRKKTNCHTFVLNSCSCEKILSNQSMCCVLAPAATVVPATLEILRQHTASRIVMAWCEKLKLDNASTLFLLNFDVWI